jgi:hypothetical protein
MIFRYSATCTTLVFLLGSLLGTFLNTPASIWYKLFIIGAATVTFHLSHFAFQPKNGSV